MDRKFVLIAMVVAVVGGFAYTVSADFTYTQLIFSLDTVLSYRMFTLGSAGTNFTNSMTTSPGNATEAYIFNSTNAYAEFVAPCDSTLTTCQTGMGIPAYRFKSTSNVNITWWMKIDAGLPLPAEVKMGVNSTSAVCGGVNIPFFVGNLNSTEWAQIKNQIGSAAPCDEANATMWANYTNKAIGAQTARLWHNSTAS